MKQIYTALVIALLVAPLTACSPAATPSTPASPQPSALNVQSLLDEQKAVCIKGLEEGENPLNKEQATTICNCSIEKVKAAVNQDSTLILDEKRMEEVSTTAATECATDTLVGK